MKKNYSFIFMMVCALLFNTKRAGAQCTTPNTVPFNETFSGITANNQLPSCWAASNMSVTCLTYTGNGYAAFYYAPSGANYFYSPGIQLYAGVTYSAGLFYKNSVSAQLNWSDLSLLVGSSQATTGLTSIASTMGPAVNSTYTPLSGTFTVASSGVYYLAVRGTGSNSGTSQYLYFDDVSLTAPCQLGNNAPVITATANPSSICSGQTVTLTAGGANTYSWSQVNGSATGSGSVFVNTPQNANPSYVVSGTNTLTGCATTFTKTVGLASPPTVSAFTDNSNNSVCIGSSLTLHAVGTANTYTWITGAFTASTNITVAPTVSGTYTVLGEGSNGCIGAATIAITVYPLPALTAQSTHTSLCAGFSTTLTANGADSYSWTSPGGSVANAATLAITPPVTETYTLTGTSASTGCTDTLLVLQTVVICIAGVPELLLSRDMALYPNPNSGAFHIAFANTTESDIRVFDMTGRLLFSSTTSGDRVDVSLEGFANGLYYVSVKAGGKTEVVKVIKD